MIAGKSTMFANIISNWPSGWSERSRILSQPRAVPACCNRPNYPICGWKKISPQIQQKGDSLMSTVKLIEENTRVLWLLHTKDSGDDWKDLVVVFGHVSGYLARVAETQGKSTGQVSACPVGVVKLQG